MIAPPRHVAIVDALPEDFCLLAVDGRKRPIDAATGILLADWTRAKSTSRLLLKRSAHVKAIGVVCGPSSGGLLVVDLDGPEAAASFKALTGHSLEELPATIAVTSGKPHRQKLFFTVVDQDQHPFIVGIGSGTKQFPSLEILWTGRQAVIAGEHPETSGYEFVDGRSLNEFSKPAEAPAWLIDPLIFAPSSEPSELPASADHETIAVILDHLNPDDFGGYEPWRNLGMALKLALPSDEGRSLWDAFSQKAPNYNAKVLERQWRSFASMEDFKRKFSDKRPVTIASFIGQAKANGYKPPASIRNLSDEHTAEKLLKDARERPSIINLLPFLRENCDVRWNELKRHVVFNDKPLDPKMARAVLADEFGIEADRSKAEEAVELVAREHPFNPVKNYLENLRGQDLPFVSDAEIAKCFGFDDGDDVSIGLLRVHLRACVKRGLQPGSKMDSLLIIQGEQGHFKSTSIEALSPDADWYDESTRFAIDSRDALSSFNSAWIYEFSEVEKLLSTNDVATLKSWITRKVDKYCEKYEKISISHPRRCCLFGTTNSSAFLIDSTGARRFWVCENVKPANVNLVKKLRDAIWHQSLIELDEGLPFFLSNDDPLFKASEERAHHATISDPWEDRLGDHLQNARVNDFVTSNSLILVLDKKIDKCHAGDYRRLASIMKRLGWKKSRRRQAGSSHPADGYVYEGLKIQPDNSTTNEQKNLDDAIVESDPDVDF